MVKSKCMVWGGVLAILVFSLFTSCDHSQKGKDKPRIKSSNSNVTSITVGSQSFDLSKDETKEFYVDEDMEENELLSKIVVVFEDANAKKEIVGENENPFERKPHEEKTYTINTFAEDGSKGKSYKVRLIRFIIDKTTEIKLQQLLSNLAWSSCIILITRLWGTDAGKETTKWTFTIANSNGEDSLLPPPLHHQDHKVYFTNPASFLN